MARTTDRAALDQWYAVEDLEDLTATPRRTRLLGQDILSWKDETGACHCREVNGADLPAQARLSYLWVTLGTPERGPIPIPEADEPDRRVVKCGQVLVKCSGLRIIENFLDLAHFPFVHTDILGAEPRTEVLTYKAEIRRDVDEVWATDCKFFQPKAAMSATEGIMVDYVYRCGSPFTVMLYKTAPSSPNRFDVICLFVQPMEEDYCRVHPVMFLLDEETPTADLVQFQQLIFLQDRIILENQRPRLLPLEPRAEIPTRADASSIAYRRWLKEKGLTYGTLEQRKAG